MAPGWRHCFYAGYQVVPKPLNLGSCRLAGLVPGFMFPIPFLPPPSFLYVRALNALLQREPWARERLAPHSGKVVSFIMGSAKASLLIQATGHVADAPNAQQPDVTLVLPANRLPDAVNLLASASPDALADLMQVQGDAGLANVVSMLAANLRPDPEHELAAVIGDTAAVRVVGLGRAVFDGARQASQRMAANVAEYVSEEAGLVASRPAFHDLTQRIAQLDARLNALDARLSQFGRPLAHRPVRGA